MIYNVENQTLTNEMKVQVVNQPTELNFSLGFIICPAFHMVLVS